MEKYQKSQIIIPSIIAIFLLLYAVPSGSPYNYYVLLRWLISFIAGYLVWMTYEENSGWAITFGLILLLFNPLVPVYLDKSTWVVLDIMTALVFGLGSILIKHGEAK